MFRLFIVTLLVVLAAACVRTTATSYTDPKYTSAYEINSALVYGDLTSLKHRQMSEDAMVSALSARRVTAVKSIDLFPPTRSYTPEQMARMVQDRSLQSVLFLVAGESGVSQSYIPQVYVPGQTTGTTVTSGNLTTFNMSTSPGYTYGGFMVNKPRGTHRAVLMDVQTGEIVWQADIEERGNAFANFEDLAAGAGRRAVSQLIDDGLVGYADN